MMKLACFTEEEWRDWEASVAVVRRFTLKEPMYPCRDCTAERQGRMVREGRCERPSVRFGERGAILPRRYVVTIQERVI